MGNSAVLAVRANLLYVSKQIATLTSWLGQSVTLVSTIVFWVSQARDIHANPQGAWLSSSLLSAIFLSFNCMFQYDIFRRAHGKQRVTAGVWLGIYMTSIAGALMNIFVVLQHGGVHCLPTDGLVFSIVGIWLAICGLRYGPQIFTHRSGKGWAAAAFRASPRLVKAAEWPLYGSAVSLSTSTSALILGLQRFVPAWRRWRRSRDHADRALMISEGVGNVLTVVPFFLLYAWTQL